MQEFGFFMSCACEVQDSGARAQTALRAHVLKLVGVTTEDPGYSLCCLSSELAVCNGPMNQSREK